MDARGGIVVPAEANFQRQQGGRCGRYIPEDAAWLANALAIDGFRIAACGNLKINAEGRAL
jgi:hypothetical protein